MIEWAMIFALGALVSGLLGLAAAAALVGRTRRVTEQRLKASLAVRRSEFAAERDQERVRHAVDIRRLEREAGKLRDQATAHRLEADLTEQELAETRLELGAREIEVDDLSERLEDSQARLLETERRLAETATELRSSRHAVEVAASRRAALQEALDETAAVAEERRLEISALRVENEQLHASLESLQRRLSGLQEVAWASQPVGTVGTAFLTAGDRGEAEAANGRVVPLPVAQQPLRPADGSADWTRSWPETWAPPQDERTPETDSIERIAADIHRMAGEAAADLERVWHAPSGPSQPDGDEERRGPGGAGPREIEAPAAGHGDAVTALRPLQQETTAETRFLEALEEIRSLRRAGGQPGE